MPKGGGDLPIPKFPYQKKLGPPNCWKGAGGSQDFGVFLKKKNSFSFLMPPLILGRSEALCVKLLNCVNIFMKAIFTYYMGGDYKSLWQCKEKISVLTFDDGIIENSLNITRSRLHIKHIFQELCAGC